jgi:hypothetical protein
MIHRKFNNLKFSRTYIGGSKKDENRIFAEVQGTKEDNSECNWLEYRRILKEYCDDKLNIILSLREVSGKLRIVFAALALLVSYFQPTVGLSFLVVASIFHALHWHLKCMELKRLSEYNFSLNTINEQTGLSLAKN